MPFRLSGGAANAGTANERLLAVLAFAVLAFAVPAKKGCDRMANGQNLHLFFLGTKKLLTTYLRSPNYYTIGVAVPAEASGTQRQIFRRTFLNTTL